MRSMTLTGVSAVLTALLLLALPACGGGGGGGGGGGEQYAQQTPQGAATGVENTATESLVSPSFPRRLSIDQLEGSIPVLAGTDDVVWRFAFGGTDYEGFDALGVTLGRPDYYQLTEESRETSALYIKLMGDMAAYVCEQIILADLDRPLSERTFLRMEDLADMSDAAVNENLRYLKLFYLAEYVTDDAGVADLRTVLTTAHDESEAAGGSKLDAARDGWGAVCMAILASPNFHIY